MNRRKFIKATVVAAAASTVFKPFYIRAQSKKYRFGFSQVTTVEPWRVQFNKDMIKEAGKHPELELIITDGQDKTEKQVADVENLIQQGVDILLVSPKESAGLTGVVLKAIDAKIPVIILDRNVETDKYTQFIGGDNVLIGREAGKYAVELLGGAGQGKRQSGGVVGWHGDATGSRSSRRFHGKRRQRIGHQIVVATDGLRLETAEGVRSDVNGLEIV